jgi:hypothetical protein
VPVPGSRQLELRFGDEAEPVDGAHGLLARLRALGLRGIRQCTLTSNRRTMVSFRAQRLRLQRAFLEAPQTVLRAVVDFVNGPSVKRRRARRTLVTVQPVVPPSRVRPRRRAPEPSRPEDGPRIARLSETHRRLNDAHFAGTLTAVAIRLSRRMRTRLGHYAPGAAGSSPEIAIGLRHLRRDGWAAACETLAHEMVHQWQHETGRPIAHDREFRAKARAIGISARARRTMVR